VPLTTGEKDALISKMSAPDWFTSSLTKPDVRAAVDAIADWVDDNQASFLAALPQPFKAQTSGAQKTLALIVVLVARNLSPDVLRAIE